MFCEVRGDGGKGKVPPTKQQFPSWRDSDVRSAGRSLRRLAPRWRVGLAGSTESTRAPRRSGLHLLRLFGLGGAEPAHSLGVQAFVAAHHLVIDRLAVLQGAEAVAFDTAEVNEHVFPFGA